MAFELTPTTAGTSLIVMAIVYGIMAVFSLYQLYLNWNQSKVKGTTEELVKLTKESNLLLIDIKNMLQINNDHVISTNEALKEALKR